MNTLRLNERTLSICDPSFLDKLLSTGERQGFVALLPAYSGAELDMSSELANRLAEGGCTELCFVGPLAGEMEDRADTVLEDLNSLGVPTTAFLDEVEGAEYFMFAADGAKAKLLIAVIEAHANLKEALVQLAVVNGWEYVSPS